MGYTGSGITRTRAHLHLEIALMLSAHYVEYSAKQNNLHGLFNGMNLAGLDVAAFYLAHKEKPGLTVSHFLASYPVYFQVTIPNDGPVEMASRYPWMISGNSATPCPSWEIAFSETGMPLSFTASDRQVAMPQITMVRRSDIPHKYRTRGLLSGQGQDASLAKEGLTLLNLLTGNFPLTPPPATALPTQ
jgi:hypothetical protein